MLSKLEKSQIYPRTMCSKEVVKYSLLVSHVFLIFPSPPRRTLRPIRAHQCIPDHHPRRPMSAPVTCNWGCFDKLFAEHVSRITWRFVESLERRVHACILKFMLPSVNNCILKETGESVRDIDSIFLPPTLIYVPDNFDD